MGLILLSSSSEMDVKLLKFAKLYAGNAVVKGKFDWSIFWVAVKNWDEKKSTISKHCEAVRNSRDLSRDPMLLLAFSVILLPVTARRDLLVLLWLFSQLKSVNDIKKSTTVVMKVKIWKEFEKL